MGARVRAKETQWAKKEQEDDLTRRRNVYLLERKKDEKDERVLTLETNDMDEEKHSHDGVSKLSEVYANELRLSQRLQAPDMRKHKTNFDRDIMEDFIRQTAANNHKFLTAESKNNNFSVRQGRYRWGFVEIRKDLERRKLERQKISATERLALAKIQKVKRHTNAAAVRELFYASCLACSGILLGSATASYALDLGSVNDVRKATKRCFDGPVLRIRERVDEYLINQKETMKGRMLERVEESEFLLTLQKVFRMKRLPPPKEA